MQRRKFMLAGGGALAYAGIGLPNALAAKLARPNKISAAMFTALLNQSFNIYASVRGVSVQLVEVKAGKSYGTHSQFSLKFAGAEGDVLPSGTYEVENASTGKLQMYLDASSNGAQGVNYRAQFTQMA